MPRFLLFILFLCLHWSAWAQVQREIRYWFDNDETVQFRATSTADQWHVDADVSKLSHSVHFIHIQAKNNKGIWSAPVTRCFYNSLGDEKVTLQYWFDEVETLSRIEVKGNAPVMLDLSALSDGVHTFHLLAKQGQMLSSIESRIFMKIPPVDETVTCFCAIDGKPYAQETFNSQNGTVIWNLDVSSLPQGFHRIKVWFVTPSGAVSNTYEKFFYRVVMPGEHEGMKLVYAIDKNTESNQVQPGVYQNGGYHFDLDVSSLSDGLHFISYALSSESGALTSIHTQYFFKTPLGGNGITQYRYWVNDSAENTPWVKLGEKKNPFQLVELLPVPTCPLRSQCFHFEISDADVPMVYAENEVHFQFVDATNHILTTSRHYVDYQVGGPIEQITELISNKRVYKTIPGNNEILWFKMNAVEGDSLSIKTDLPCVYQIFSPSGHEVKRIDRAGSTEYDGCHAAENGTYYLAVHDVLDSHKKTIAVDYQHIDKHEVLSSNADVKGIGNGGYSTITYHGNGFDDLYKVLYVNDANDTIPCESIVHLSDATVETITSFYDAPVSKYTPLFYFAGEMIEAGTPLKIVEPVDIRISAESNVSSYYYQNKYTWCDYTLTNKGNMTAYRVPLYIHLNTPKSPLAGENLIGKIEISGIDFPKISDDIDLESLDEAGRAKLKSCDEDFDQTSYFVHTRGFDPYYGNSREVKSGYFFVDIPAYTTLKITVKPYISQGAVYFTMRVPENMAPQVPSSVDRDNRFDNCCVHDRIKCVTSMMDTGADMVNRITSSFKCSESTALSAISCATGVFNDLVAVSGDVLCGNKVNGKTLKDKLNAFPNGISSLSTLTACLKNVLPSTTFAKGIDAFLTGAKDDVLPDDVNDCIDGFITVDTDCPTGKKLADVSYSMPASSGPNEMLGYIAESGSRYVSKSQQDLNYTIRFANDSAWAKTSVREVIIRDTLDRKMFNLKSYHPTSFRVADQMVELDGKPVFTQTIDMRPRINALAQVKGSYDNQSGIMEWHFTSLDPMTMEPVQLPELGFLSINNTEGHGQGEVRYTVQRLPNLEDGAVLSNQAAIILDQNEPVMTPVWTNILDAVPPISRMTSAEQKNDSTLTLHFRGEDKRSGVWRYNIYAQVSSPEWIQIAANLTDTVFDYRIYDGMDYGFYVVAVDSAGNVEPKIPARELTHATYMLGDANGDKTVDTEDLLLVVRKYLGYQVYLNMDAADVVKDGVLDVEDVRAICELYLSTSQRKKSKAK